MNKTNLGLIGLGTMGKGLARNMASRGYSVSVWNRTTEKITEFVSQFGSSFYEPNSFEDFIESIEAPRKIVVMLPAGAASQATFRKLAQVLEPGDMVMDGANALFRLSDMNQGMFQEKGIHFLGTGISGGEQGALYGPSIMPGGSLEAWEAFQPILQAIAAEDFEGGPCVAYMGRAGAGHYVKMVHNGIEYADMQALAEAYELIHKLYRISHPEIAQIFRKWNEGTLESYLTEISVDILEREEDGKPLLDLILDKAKHKGTGQWTSQEALALGVPCPGITGAVYMRGFSSNKEQRERLSKEYPREQRTPEMTLSEFAAHLEKALLLARLIHFEQGFALMRAADAEYEYGLNYPEILRIWQGGCVIRCQALKKMHSFFKEHPNESLYLSDFMHTAAVEGQKSLRIVVQAAIQHGLPVHVLSSALTHFDASRQARGSANFIQGLRDRFGSHGYERVDQEGSFHTQWE